MKNDMKMIDYIKLKSVDTILNKRGRLLDCFTKNIIITGQKCFPFQESLKYYIRSVQALFFFFLGGGGSGVVPPFYALLEFDCSKIVHSMLLKEEKEVREREMNSPNQFNYNKTKYILCM